MGEILIVLAVAALALFIVIAGVYALWRLGAAILRGIFSSGSPTPSRPIRRCPRCKDPIREADLLTGRCRRCNYALEKMAVAEKQAEPSASTTPQAELAATERQLNRWRRAGALDADQWENLQSLLQQEREKLTPTAPKVQQPAPTASVAPPPLPPREPQPASSGPVSPVTAAPLPPTVESSTAPAVSTEAPARPFSNLLQAFMEEKNIRWGELVSGMLIVGSAIGLVISLWATLREWIPYFPALLFLMVTAALHGAGWYTLRRWKLRATSHGLLIISALLVPLNFLAGIAVSDKRPIDDPLYLTAIGVGLIAFGAISVSASRLLLRRRWLPLAVAIMGPSTGQLIISRYATPESTTLDLARLAILPFVSFLIAMINPLRMMSLGSHLTRRRVSQTFLLLGVGLFALVVPVGLIVWKTQSLESTLAALSPWLSAGAGVMLCAGLIVHRRLQSPVLAATRTAGTALAVTGGLAMIAPVVLAWPQPNLLIAVGLVNFVLLTGMGIAGRLPVLHVPAVAAAGFVGLVAFHLFQGQLSLASTPTGREFLEVLVMGRSGLVCLALTVVVALAAGVLKTLGRTADALGYAGGAGVLVVVSTSIAVYAGFVSGVDGDLATLIFAAGAIAVLPAAALTRHPALSWLGSGLLLLTSAHGLGWNETIQSYLVQLGAMPARPLVVAALIHASLVALLVLSVRTLVGNRDQTSQTDSTDQFVGSLCQSGLVSSSLTLPIIVGGVSLSLAASHAVYAGWMAAIWICIAFVLNLRALIAASQALGTFAVMLAATALVQNRDGWDGNLLGALHIQMQLGALAIWCASWSIARLAVRPLKRVHDLLASPWSSVDRVVLNAVVGAVLVVSVTDCLPGIAAELQTSAALPVVQPAATLILVVLCGLSIGLIASLGGGASRSFVALTFVGLTAFLLPLPEDATSANGALFIDGAGCWIVWLLVVAALIVSLWERVSLATLSSLLVAGASATLLIAARFQAEAATASALRWSLAVYGLLIAIVLCNRDRLSQWTRRLGLSTSPAGSAAIYNALRPAAIGLTVLPILALCLRTVFALSTGSAVWVPEPLFGQAGAGWSFAAPCGVLAISVVAYAIRDRIGDYALAGSLLAQVGIALAVIVPAGGAESIGTPQLVTMLQYVAIGLGLYGLAWVSLARRLDSETSIGPRALDAVPTAIDIHQWLSLGVVASLSIWAAFAVCMTPSRLPQHLGLLGTAAGLVAVIVVAAGWLVYTRNHWPRSVVETACGVATAGVPLVAAHFLEQSSNTDWLAYHILTGGWCTVSVLGGLFAAAAVSWRNDAPGVDLDGGRQDERLTSHWSDPAAAWALAVGALVIVLAVRGELHDPSRPWWSAVPTLLVAISVAVVGIRKRSQLLAYASTALLMLSAAFVWLRPWIGLETTQTGQDWVNLFEAILVAASVSGFFWLLVTLYFQRGWDEDFDPNFRLPPVHQSTAIGVLLLAAMLTGGGLILRTLAITFAGGAPVDVSNPGGWLLIGSLTLLVSVSVWDRAAKHAIACLYLLGLVAGAIDLDALELQPHHLLFAASCGATSYVLLTGLVWTQRQRILDFAEQMDMPKTTLDPARVAGWLPTANAVLAGLGVFGAFVVALTFDDWEFRVGAATGAALAVPGFAALAQGARRERMQFHALTAAAIAAVCFGWATMPISGEPHYWLHRAVRLMVMLAGSASLYGVVLIRVLPAGSAWFRSTWRATVLTGAGALASLLAVLVLEAVWVDRAAEVLTGADIAVVATVLVGLSAALVSLALLPGADPLKLSERGRMFYVYAAEVVLSLLFLHIRLTMPELFRGLLLPYWPFIVMGIAFFGVGVGELLQRRGVRVLSEPLRRTGAFLPLLPAIGFWIHLSQSENPLVGDYSTLLFAIGVLYVLLSMWRKSFVYSVLAAVAGNGGLWALLSEQDLTLLARPQMWLIPPAVSVLVAAQVNRNRLNEAQLTGIRYLSVIVIYASSTSEMFLTGVGESLWLPMVLATLSVGGVLAGIAMRVRAFLYLGSSFLMLSIISMIWHAARNIGHVWPWWAFGIVLGLAILTLFGLFEKKRTEMEQLVAGLRRWDR